MRVLPLLIAACLVLSCPAARAADTSSWRLADMLLPSVGTPEPPVPNGHETLPQMTIYRLGAISLGAVVGVAVANGAAAGFAAAGAGGLVRNFTATMIRDATVAVGATIGGFVGNWIYLRNWGYFNQSQQ